ncbi:MAG: GAF domain-containing protein, partial [Achromobacter sp.]
RDDSQRLAVLHQLGILDTPRESVFDNITQEASRILETPIAMVSLLDKDRDWFKAVVGFNATESAAETSFCNVFFAVKDDTVVIEDTLQDARFATHPLVLDMPFIRFYAAVRLRAAGHTVGSLCVYDTRERRPATAQVRQLQALGDATVHALQARATVH